MQGKAKLVRGPGREKKKEKGWTAQMEGKKAGPK